MRLVRDPFRDLILCVRKGVADRLRIPAKEIDEKWN